MIHKCKMFFAAKFQFHGFFVCFQAQLIPNSISNWFSCLLIHFFFIGFVFALSTYNAQYIPNGSKWYYYFYCTCTLCCVALRRMNMLWRNNSWVNRSHNSLDGTIRSLCDTSCVIIVKFNKPVSSMLSRSVVLGSKLH